MKNTYNILLLVILALPFHINCDCASSDVKDAFNKSDIVLTGLVESKVDGFVTLDSTRIQKLEKLKQQKYFSNKIICSVYIIKVLKTYKGSTKTKTITLKINEQNNCRIALKNNTKYVIYANRISENNEIYVDFTDKDSDFFTTSICSRTTESVKREIKLIRAAGL